MGATPGHKGPTAGGAPDRPVEMARTPPQELTSAQSIMPANHKRSSGTAHRQHTHSQPREFGMGPTSQVDSAFPLLCLPGCMYLESGYEACGALRRLLNRAGASNHGRRSTGGRERTAGDPLTCAWSDARTRSTPAQRPRGCALPVPAWAAWGASHPWQHRAPEFKAHTTAASTPYHPIRSQRYGECNTREQAQRRQEVVHPFEAPWNVHTTHAHSPQHVQWQVRRRQPLCSSVEQSDR